MKKIILLLIFIVANTAFCHDSEIKATYTLRHQYKKSYLCMNSKNNQLTICDRPDDLVKIVSFSRKEFGMIIGEINLNKELITLRDWYLNFIEDLIIDPYLDLSNETIPFSKAVFGKTKDRYQMECALKNTNEDVLYSKKEINHLIKNPLKMDALFLIENNEQCFLKKFSFDYFKPQVIVVYGHDSWSNTNNLFPKQTISISEYQENALKKELNKESDLFIDLLLNQNINLKKRIANLNKFLKLNSQEIALLRNKKRSYYLTKKDKDFIKYNYIKEFQEKYNVRYIPTKKVITIAIIDTGINTQILDIQDKIYNPKNKPNFYGYDFSGTGIEDHHGHGTNVAGIILGVNPNVKILPIKYYNPMASGMDNLKQEINAIQAAIDAKVDVINISAGGPEISLEEKNVIKKAKDAGIIVVTALGNESENIDQKGKNYYPASYNLENQISVANYNQYEKILNDSSNYSINMETVAAFGYGIKAFGIQLTGTSQATPFITGAISIYLAHSNTKPSFSQIKQIIKDSSIKKQNLKTKYGLFDFNKFALLVGNNNHRKYASIIKENQINSLTLSVK